MNEDKPTTPQQADGSGKKRHRPKKGTIIGEKAPAAALQVLRESRWEANGAVLATLLLHLWLPDRLNIGPTFLLTVLGIVILLPLIFLTPVARTAIWYWRRVLTIAVVALVSFANVFSLILLVDSLLHSDKDQGSFLILEAGKIWLINVLVFALWYWMFDRGGPSDRIEPEGVLPDFLFPQMTLPDNLAEKWWTPSFIDYLYVSFTNSTAFSPTDTQPLTRWAKILMLMQSLASLLTLAFVAARAVNILS